MFWLILGIVFLMSFLLTPPVRALAWRMGALDVPVERRRMHRVVIPRNGGLAILLPFFLGAFLAEEPSAFLRYTLFGGGFVMAVGLVDDIVCLGAGTKLLFQVAGAFGTVLGSGFGESWGAVWLGVLWVVILTNAHNFIDGMDGLLCSCCAAEGLLLGGTLFLSGQVQLAKVSLLLVAALLGFRFYNRYPADIFPGDCGSEAVGFLLGMLSLPLFKAPAWSIQNLAPLFLFAYPLSDLALAVLRRILHGRSPFAADRAHLHHRLFAAGLTVPECVGMLESICFFFGGVGICLSGVELWAFAGGMCAFTAALLVFCRRCLLRAGERQRRLPGA